MRCVKGESLGGGMEKDGGGRPDVWSLCWSAEWRARLPCYSGCGSRTIFICARDRKRPLQLDQNELDFLHVQADLNPLAFSFEFTSPRKKNPVSDEYAPLPEMPQDSSHPLQSRYQRYQQQKHGRQQDRLSCVLCGVQLSLGLEAYTGHFQTAHSDILEAELAAGEDATAIGRKYYRRSQDPGAG